MFITLGRGNRRDPRGHPLVRPGPYDRPEPRGTGSDREEGRPDARRPLEAQENVPRREGNRNARNGTQSVNRVMLDDCFSRIRAVEAELATSRAGKARAEAPSKGVAESVTQVRVRFYYPGTESRKIFEGAGGELPSTAATYSIGTVLLEKLMPQLTEVGLHSPLHQELVNQLNHLVAQHLKGLAEMPQVTLDDRFTVQVMFPGHDGKLVSFSEARLAPYLIACEYVGSHRVLPVDVRMILARPESGAPIPRIRDFSTAFGTYVPDHSIEFGRHLQKAAHTSAEERQFRPNEVYGEDAIEALPLTPVDHKIRLHYGDPCKYCKMVHISKPPCKPPPQPRFPYKEALTASGIPRPPTPGTDVVQQAMHEAKIADTKQQPATSEPSNKAQDPDTEMTDDTDYTDPEVVDKLLAK
jgi:hypothetical protein